MVKHALHPSRIRSWWTMVVAAMLAGCWLAATPVFAQGQPDKPAPAAGKPQALAPKPAPKTVRKETAKKAVGSKTVAAAKLQLPAKQKIQPVTSGHRDPFKQPEPPSVGPEGRIENEARAPGQRVLAVAGMVVEGIVMNHASYTMIAVVAGPERRAYFLRVNDPVYHATVSRITTDSVYFAETFKDPAGHESTREVVKKMPATGEKP